MSVRYRLFLLLIALPVTLLFIWQAFKQREWRFLLERAGFIKTRLKDPIWFHAASVGEVNAVAPFIKYSQEQQPNQSIIITTTTATGAETAKRLLPDIEHHYFPFDYQIHIHRALKGIKPKAVVIVETEIWPNLYAQCHRQKIPLLIINGRLSDKTSKASNWIRNLYSHSLKNVPHIFTRSDEDRERFIQLGANNRRKYSF